MAISPKDVIESIDTKYDEILVNSCEKYVDSCLSDRQWLKSNTKLNGTSGDGRYWYVKSTDVFHATKLTLGEKKELIKRYTKAGWPEVHVTNEEIGGWSMMLYELPRTKPGVLITKDDV